MRRADHVITICQGLRGEICRRGVAQERITVVPNFVDVDQFSPNREVDQALAGSLGLSGAKVLGFIGSFYKYEGLSFLIDAMARVAGRHPDLKLLLVGGRRGGCQDPSNGAGARAGRTGGHDRPRAASRGSRPITIWSMSSSIPECAAG